MNNAIWKKKIKFNVISENMNFLYFLFKSWAPLEEALITGKYGCQVLLHTC